MHFFVVGSQMLPVAQSPFCVHSVLQAVAPHAYEPHGTGGGT